MRPVVLLGPQRLRPTLVEAVDLVGVDGPVAAVTAGWQEREDEIDELSAHLGRPTFNLQLHRRGEAVLARDPELLLAYGDLLDRTRKLQDLYRIRLAHGKAAARALLAQPADADLLEQEVDAAVDDLRHIDQHHALRVRRLQASFDEEWRPSERPAVAEHREEIARILDGCRALAIAGGHVQVLIDRLRLFGLADLSSHLPLFAWSGGAMVVSELVVLFHDSPPQGAGNSEVWGPGLGLCPGVVPLPHARKRLHLEDRTRVLLLARRFAPARCIAMDEGSRVRWDEVHGLEVDTGRELLPAGDVAEVGSP